MLVLTLCVIFILIKPQYLSVNPKVTIRPEEGVDVVANEHPCYVLGYYNILHKNKFVLLVYV